MNRNWRLTELAWWFERFDFRERLLDFGRPHPGIWPAQEERFAECIQKIQLALKKHPQYLCYFYGTLLSSALLDVNSTPSFVWTWLKRNVNLNQLGIYFELEELTSWKWTCLPLILTGQIEASLVWVLLGAGNQSQISLWPTWVENRLDPKARQAIQTASALVSDLNFFFWPQIFPFGRTSFINGYSLGLPVYLGFRSLVKDQPLSPRIISTGHITLSGQIKAIANLEAKVSIAKQKGISVLLYPHENKCPLVSDLTLIPVNHVTLAWEMAKNNEHEQIEIALKQGDLRWFVNNFDRLSLKSLYLLFEQKNYASKLAKEFLTDQELLEVLVVKVERLAQDPNFPQDKINPFLDKLFSWSYLQKLGQIYPDLTIRVIKLQIKRANFKGQVQEAQFWQEKSKQFLPYLSLTEATQYDLVLWIKKIVGTYYNRYEFVPERISPIIKRFLPLENTWEQAIQKNQLLPEPLLGQFYGTLAQFFGFCKDLKQVEKYAQKACLAFAQGKITRYLEDWRRQYNYLVYAYLDHAQKDQALTALQVYLGKNLYPFAGPETPYKHATLIRFLADTRLDLSNYLETAVSLARDVPPQHPWQLWLLNLGRIVQENELKKRLWEKSVEICLSSRSETMGIMALLGLSYLYQNHFQTCLDLKAKTHEVITNLKHSRLSLEHFAPVLQATTWQGVLETVCKHRPTLFPFTYR